MRVIIAGSRGFCTDPSRFTNKYHKELCRKHHLKLIHFLDTVFEDFDNISQIISGTARGTDKAGEKFAEAYGIPILKFPANWNKYGKSAGYRRNVEMAENADCLVAVWDGKSKGTKHMIDIARDKRLEVHIFKYKEDHEEE